MAEKLVDTEANETMEETKAEIKDDKESKEMKEKKETKEKHKQEKKGKEKKDKEHKETKEHKEGKEGKEHKEHKEKKEKDKKAEKTFNDLAPEFQWNSTLDPDHIFEAEHRLIQQMRQELPELENESDKFILVFLLARRHDIPETVSLLKKFLKLKKEYEISSIAPPSFTHNPYLIKMRNTMDLPAFQPTGFQDKHDRMLRYFFMGTDNPTVRETKAVYTMLFWQTFFLIATEPLFLWRNGVAVVVDLKGFGWKNIDMSSKGRAINRDVQGTYPFRLRTLFAVNGGSILNGLIQAARLVVPRKIMSRVVQIDAAHLQDYVPVKYLLKRYEGEAEMDYDGYVQQILEQEEILYQKEIWKRDVAAGAD